MNCRTFTILAIGIFVNTAICGCGTQPPATSPTGPVDSNTPLTSDASIVAQQTMGPQGGTISFPLNERTAVVEVPSGALSTMTTVTIRLIAPPGPAPQGAKFQPDQAFEIVSDQADFAVPVLMHIPVWPLYPENHYVVGWWNGNAWVPLPSAIDTTARMMTGQTMHFSSFAPICIPGGEAGTPYEFEIASPSGTMKYRLRVFWERAWNWGQWAPKYFVVVVLQSVQGQTCSNLEGLQIGFQAPMDPDVPPPGIWYQTNWGPWKGMIDHRDTFVVPWASSVKWGMNVLSGGLVSGVSTVFSYLSGVVGIIRPAHEGLQDGLFESMIDLSTQDIASALEGVLPERNVTGYSVVHTLDSPGFPATSVFFYATPPYAPSTPVLGKYYRIDFNPNADVRSVTGYDRGIGGGNFVPTITRMPVSWTSDLAVNAGPDLVASSPDSGVQLQGSVPDSPNTGPVIAWWKKISGPGDVSFSNQNDPTATATFSEPGVYSLRLTAFDWRYSGDDNVVVTVPGSACVPTPTISPNGGTYTGSVSVTLGCSDTLATIRYTTNGTDPTSLSTQYTGAFTLTSSATVKAKGFRSGYNDSNVASASFTVNPTPTVPTPTISPNGGTYTGSVSVTLGCSDTQATIRYTTNGTDPTSSSTQYTGAFTLTSSATVKAKGFRSGYNDSSLATASFTIQVVPIISSIPDATIEAGSSYSVTPSLSQGTAPITWSLTSPSPLPPGMAISSSNGIISWSSAIVGTYYMNLRATNAAGSADEPWTLTVTQPCIGACVLTEMEPNDSVCPSTPGNTLVFCNGVATATGVLTNNYDCFTLCSITEGELLQVSVSSTDARVNAFQGYSQNSPYFACSFMSIEGQCSAFMCHGTNYTFIAPYTCDYVVAISWDPNQGAGSSAQYALTVSR